MVAGDQKDCPPRILKPGNARHCDHGGLGPSHGGGTAATTRKRGVLRMDLFWMLSVPKDTPETVIKALFRLYPLESQTLNPEARN